MAFKMPISRVRSVIVVCIASITTSALTTAASNPIATVSPIISPAIPRLAPIAGVNAVFVIGACAIIGGHVVRGSALPGLRGRYVYGDLCEGVVRGARLSPGRATGRRRFRVEVPTLSTFGQDARGRVYAASLDGPVYRLVPSG